jgi:hypothetical protein
MHIGHFSHCIEMIRQSLMCSADITPMVWQWSEKDQKTQLHVDVAHTCRNWESISVWAKEHRYDGEFEDAFRRPEMGQCGAEDDGCP